MTRLKTWTRTKLRNVPHVVADIGLNFTTAVIATIDGLGDIRRGRCYIGDGSFGVVRANRTDGSNR